MFYHGHPVSLIETQPNPYAMQLSGIICVLSAQFYRYRRFCFILYIIECKLTNVTFENNSESYLIKMKYNESRANIW